MHRSRNLLCKIGPFQLAGQAQTVRPGLHIGIADQPPKQLLWIDVMLYAGGNTQVTREWIVCSQPVSYQFADPLRFVPGERTDQTAPFTSLPRCLNRAFDPL